MIDTVCNFANLVITCSSLILFFLWFFMRLLSRCTLGSVHIRCGKVLSLFCMVYVQCHVQCHTVPLCIMYTLCYVYVYLMLCIRISLCIMYNVIYTVPFCMPAATRHPGFQHHRTVHITPRSAHLPWSLLPRADLEGEPQWSNTMMFTIYQTGIFHNPYLPMEGSHSQC